MVARRASHGNEDHYSLFLPPADLKGGQVCRSRTEVLRMLGLITGAGKPKKPKGGGGGGGGSGGGSGGGTSGVKRERKKLDVWPGENAADEEPLRNVEPPTAQIMGLARPRTPGWQVAGSDGRFYKAALP